MPASPLHVLRLNARELLRQPGLRKEIDATLDPALFGIDDDRITGDLAIEVHAESGVDGIVVRGTIGFPWAAPCRRCLANVAGTARIELDETYQDDAADGGVAYPIEGDQIDLAPVVREHVVLELPDGPLCKPDCAGMCPVCGIDRNVASCDCDTSMRDERWAVLDDLRLDD